MVAYLQDVPKAAMCRLGVPRCKDLITDGCAEEAAAGGGTRLRRPAQRLSRSRPLGCCCGPSVEGVFDECGNQCDSTGFADDGGHRVSLLPSVNQRVRFSRMSGR